MTSAAESPRSNGIWECLNGVLGTLVNKTLYGTKCEMLMTITLVGFWFKSSNSRHFFFHNKLPSFEEVTSSEIVRRNLNALHVARYEFVKVESNERIKKTLRQDGVDQVLLLEETKRKC
ncbi:unnamed protein product [Meganyctiphanes norvegica]|uniref:Integrase catalytic domain-containing protein n=1 Tax=Meganyctiphanes norvegica TaxID=48144 RepID=A0AAV2PVI6_MEGNR